MLKTKGPEEVKFGASSTWALWDPSSPGNLLYIGKKAELWRVVLTTEESQHLYTTEESQHRLDDRFPWKAPYYEHVLLQKQSSK